MSAYYNEIDPFAAQWLRNLIALGYIADGEVDERSIEDVRPEELRGFTQCHFFAGIGVWSYALRRAGWPDDRRVWTGSCPCQPFSAAGKRAGTADERHLWPAWEWLIRHGKPRGVPVFGEQVASKDGLAWLDIVSADLEGQGYTVRAADLCAAGVGAPHIRQRLYFVADASGERRAEQRVCVRPEEAGRKSGDIPETAGRSDARRQRGQRANASDQGELADTGRAVHERVRGPGEASSAARPAESEAQQWQWGGAAAGPGGASSVVADAAHNEQHRSGDAGTGRRSEPADRSVVGNSHHQGPQGRSVSGAVAERLGADQRATREAGAAGGLVADTDGRDASAEGVQRGGEHGLVAQDGGAGFWSACDWLPCIDGKARPVEPGTFPLAHGAPARVGRLRAYGNAIVAPLAEEFIRAYMTE